MSRKIELVINAVLFGAIPPLVGLLAGWWLAIPFLPERLIWSGALAGLAAGALVDAAFLRGWLRQVYAASALLWAGAYLFYSVGVFGFFMGVPLFNAFLGLPAGFFLGAWLVHQGAGAARVRQVARQLALFVTGVLACFCVASAALALSDHSTAANLEGMFSLSFALSPWMIWGAILLGGAALLAFEWWLAQKAVQMSHAWLTHAQGA